MFEAGTDSSSKLALLGGGPVSSPPLRIPAWPETNEATAERLREVYFSRRWSFNCPAEKDFAQAYATYHDTRHGIFMVNGTVTLQGALAA